MKRKEVIFILYYKRKQPKWVKNQLEPKDLQTAYAEHLRERDEKLALSQENKQKLKREIEIAIDEIIEELNK